MRDGLDSELVDERAAEGLIADGRAQQLEPIAETLHFLGEGVWGALASKKGVIASVERIVSNGSIPPELIHIPGSRVLAVCEIPPPIVEACALAVFPKPPDTVAL